MSIPHDRIRAQQDRSWTPVLVERLRDAAGVERLELARTLCVVHDPRAVDLLTALVSDRDASVDAREAAGEILRDEFDAPSDATLRRWWREGDRTLREHALRSMDHTQADLVLAVAANPRDPLYGAAIRTMSFGFEAPAHQQLKIAALSHVDAEVRFDAARTLLWDEPCAAEEPLIVRLDDLDGQVAIAAAEALAYYRTRRSLRELSSRPYLLADAVTGAAELAEAFVEMLRPLPAPAQLHLRRWLLPVEDLLIDALDTVDDEVLPPPRPPTPVLAEVVDVDRLVAALASVDGPWAATRAQVQNLRPELVSPDDRPALARAVLEHGDNEVRFAGAAWLAMWGDAHGLLALLRDPSFLVRKAAAYGMAALPPDPALAPVLRAHLDDPGTTGAHARETLKSYVTHAERGDAIATLTGLVHDDERESVVHEAVHALIELEAGAALATLMRKLAEPPQVTWAVHVALLVAARRFGLAPVHRAALAEVDQLDVQVALALLDARI